MRFRSVRSGRVRSRGFTFLEIIMVVAIIGILSAMVGPHLVGMNKESKIKTTRAQMESIKTSLHLFEQSQDELPATSEGLAALVRKPSGASDSWRRYMEKIPRDAWGEEFIYRYPSEHGLDFDLTSKGPDRVEGSEDDITLWEDEKRSDA